MDRMNLRRGNSANIKTLIHDRRYAPSLRSLEEAKSEGLTPILVFSDLAR